MGYKESNPIQQRMDMLVEKWEATVANPAISVVRIHAQDNEKDMVGAFYKYLLGVDTQNHDIPVIFNSIYHNDSQYTKALLYEIDEMINTWNNANKDKVKVEIKNVEWHPDYSLIKPNNPAYLFVENMNNLAIYLNLHDGIYLVPILRVSFTQPKQFNRWMDFAIKAEIHPKVKLVVDDSVSNPFFETLFYDHPDKVSTLIPQLDMDNAMQQLAAMGNPNDPAVQYRKAFISLMQAIEKRKGSDVEKHAASCIEIATKNLEKNPYWIGQIITIYAALANDQIGYKNYQRAIGYSTQGVVAAERSKEIITDEFIYRKFMAQAIMLRASLYSVTKEWEKAIADFTLAADHYVYTNDVILAMEALRMTGFCNQKYGDNDAACKALTNGIYVSDQIPDHTIKFTTFAGIIEMLLEINNSKYISDEEVEETAESVYGEDWRKEIINWKNPNYEQVSDPTKVMMS